jgi:hypothetical protein
MPMNFTFEERPADSPLIETVWQAHDGHPGSFVSTAKGYWEIGQTPARRRN